jgi:hypothetical protein
MSLRQLTFSQMAHLRALASLALFTLIGFDKGSTPMFKIWLTDEGGGGGGGRRVGSGGGGI